MWVYVPRRKVRTIKIFSEIVFYVVLPLWNMDIFMVVDWSFTAFPLFFFFFAPAQIMGRKFSVWWLILRATTYYTPPTLSPIVARILWKCFRDENTQLALMLIMQLHREYDICLLRFGTFGRCNIFRFRNMAELLNPLPTLSDRISILYII